MQKLRDNLLNLLARRDYSSYELVRKMQIKGHDLALIEHEIAALTQAGLQSDERCAQMVSEHCVLKGKGPLYLRQKLMEKGLGRDIIDECMQHMDVGQAMKNANYRLRNFDGILRRKRLIAWGFSTEEME